MLELLVAVNLFISPVALPSQAEPATSAATSTASATTRDKKTDEERRINLNRPTRGAMSSSIRKAATVPDGIRPFAECVLRRESGGVLHNKQSREDARNGSSSASGRWQMLDGSGWREGVGWLVQKRLVKFGVPRANAVRVREHLQATPIYKIDGFWQDIAFIQSVEEGGWRHWANGDKCDGLAP